MKKCLVCDHEYEPFISFGTMPIANGFLTPQEFKDEYFFELKVGFCPNCKMVQLAEVVDRERMFHEHYAFYSSTSAWMTRHFKGFSEFVRANYLKSPDPFVVEIGSNDGIMLQNFSQLGIRHLGIEPSANVAQVALDKGINTISKFFDENTAREIVSEHGRADAFLGANVMCHIPYIHSIVAGIKLLIKPEGVVIFEDPYLGDIIEKTSYDQIYDEHAFFFSVSSVSYLFGQHDIEVIDVLPQNVHGGSMRYVLGNKGYHPVSNAVREQLKKEASLGLDKPETYARFKKNVERSRTELMDLLRSLKNEGKRVVGYGATSKSTTITNYCGITPDLVEFIGDTTPIKQGKFSPGAHIPVRPYSDFSARYPEYALLFAWNHQAEIIQKESKFLESGGEFIVYVPHVQTLKSGTA